ncbi:hypothetical protein N7539_005172 [Penicillium diatomitis]|uniref:Uncharacterized protein n=1 Tax=Penicillium diatomitis TaxID=2819901 RepID=A0A9W9X6D2_9EURO|nr:uncharacterized protein N7539_005172 [Penicillium diatomitis]KAJ5485184.1 hypothetical protein N7539_005172 [Penicillium diatomitis]
MRLYAFGSNGSGQLGIGHTEDVSAPTQCLFDAGLAPEDTISHLVAGGNHTLLLTRLGRVYVAGCNADGRCGPLSSDDSKHIEQNLLRFKRVILTDSATGWSVDTFRCVSATWEGSVLVAAVPSGPEKDLYEDKVFVMGSSPKGELGVETGPACQTVDPGCSIPSFPPKGTEIIALASGMGHSIAILSNGRVYGWGGSRKGQLGDGLKAQKLVFRPTEIQGVPFAAQSAVCGREFTVICGERSQGEFVVLGEKTNRWGILNVPSGLQLPSTETHDQFLVPFSAIGASWHGIYVHTTSQGADRAANRGRLIAWGRNDRGQLPPEGLPSIVKMAVGSEHVLVLMHDGTVAAFGWGEHGNCGPETDDRGNVAERFSQIPLDTVVGGDKRVVGLGAGCATSWILVD